MKWFVIVLLLLLVACNEKPKTDVFLENKPVPVFDNSCAKDRLIFEGSPINEEGTAKAGLISIFEDTKISTQLKSECMNAIEIFREAVLEVPYHSRSLKVYVLTNLTKCGRFYATEDGKYYLNKECN